MQVHDKIFIDGKWVSSSAAEMIDVISASSEEVIGRVPDGTVRDVDAAVHSARGAFAGWSSTSPEERAAILQKIVDGLKARSDEIARVITDEVGMPLKMSSRMQVASPTAIFSSYAKSLGAYEFERRIGNSLVMREAIGVVACITPWNYPLHQVAAKVAPALAAGCTVVLKPSEVAPLSAFILADIMQAAGLPAGVFNLVSGQGVVVGEAMAAHPDVDMVSFTGSTRAGKRVSELAAGTVKRVALELGGKSAAVVLDGADLGQAVNAVVSGCYLNSGQTCSAPTRLLVSQENYDEAARLAVAAAAKFAPSNPFEETTRLGPLASAAQRERVRGHIRKAQSDGAQLLCGGADAPAGLQRGYYVSPTIFGRVDPRSAIAQEEIFGPVLCILTYEDEADAVRIANDSIYGLAGQVWAATDDDALRVARKMRTGQIDLNGGTFNMKAPFGGYKQSGNGRELGDFGLEEFLEVKSLQFKPEPKPATG